MLRLRDWRWLRVGDNDNENVSENASNALHNTPHRCCAADNDRTIIFAQSIRVNRRYTTFQRGSGTNTTHTRALPHSPQTTRDWIQFRHYMRKYLPTHPTEHARALACGINLHNTFPFASFLLCSHTCGFTSKNMANKTLRCRVKAYNVHCCSYNLTPKP